MAPAPSKIVSDLAVANFRQLDCGYLWHPWSGDSCSRGAVEFALSVASGSSKIYALVHLLPAIFGRKSLQHILQQTLPSIFWSTSFLTSQAGFLLAFCCLQRHLFGANYVPTVLTATLMSSLSLFLERKSRRSELAVYICTQALYATWKKAVELGLVRDLRSGDVLLFSLALAALVRSRRHAPHTLSHTSTGILKTFFGIDDEARQDAQPTPQQREPASEAGAGAGRRRRVRVVAPPPPTTRGMELVRRLLLFFNVTNTHAGRSTLCSHPASCLTHSTYQGLRSVGVGWAISVLFALPAIAKATFKRDILGILQNVFSVKLGFGLGSVAFVFHVADCVLRRVSGRNDSFNSAAAGFIAGLGFISIRSSSIALYLLGKAAEALYWEAHERGLVPTHPHGDVFLYSISVSVLLHFAVIEPRLIPRAYWNFASVVTQGKFMRIRRDELEKIGYNSLPAFARRKKPIPHTPEMMLQL